MFKFGCYQIFVSNCYFFVITIRQYELIAFFAWLGFDYLIS